jgi:hypothetical protein
MMSVMACYRQLPISEDQNRADHLQAEPTGLLRVVHRDAQPEDLDEMGVPTHCCCSRFPGDLEVGMVYEALR